MKSKMKKLVSLVLAMAMVFTMSAVVFADDSYTITINNTADGHTYEAYQIFAGTLADDEETLTAIKWGSAVSESANLYTDLAKIEDSTKSTNPFADCDSAEDVATVLGGYNDSSAVAIAFADVISGYLSSTATASTDELIAASGTAGEADYVAAHYEIKVTSAGYYLVKDKDATLANADDAYTDYILEVVGNVSVTPKSSTPEVEKKVEEKNDSTGTTSDWQDAADYDINDSINYKLTGTLPSTLDTYSTYYYQFVDTLSVGLTYNNNAVVTVYANSTATEGTVVSTGYEVTDATVTDAASDYYNGTTLKVTIADVYKLYDANGKSISVTSSSVIVVTYSATLNTSAVIGADGNPNEVYLVYSNNPNNAGSGETGKTPEDKVTVFTFTLDVNKVKSDGSTPLTGAGFTLYKLNANTGEYETVGSEIKGDSTTTFTFKGLDSGFYRISETTVPDGYNKADDIYFEIAATYEKDDTDPSLLTLKVYESTSSTTSSTGTEDSDFTVANDLSSISTKVINKSGSILPSTGGIGTTIFYIVGAVLVLGAGVILVTRRRTRA